MQCFGSPAPESARMPEAVMSQPRDPREFGGAGAEQDERRAIGRAAIAGFVLAVLVVGGAAVAGVRLFSPETVQPIAFDHRLHAVENGIECATCHSSFQQETFAGLPAADVCATCHGGEPLGKSPEEARLAELLKARRPLEWAPLYGEPPHVFFSHRRHVAAGAACESCHKGMADARAPPLRVARLRMADCLACHRRVGAATDCSACHR